MHIWMTGTGVLTLFFTGFVLGAAAALYVKHALNKPKKESK